MKKKFILDVIFNTFAAVIPIFGLQFLVLPLVSVRLEADLYGQLLTLIAFISLSSTTFGSVLNNSKLIHYSKYQDRGIQGDYNIILMFFLVFNFIISTVGIIYYQTSGNILTLFILVISSTLLLYNTYSMVEFRINLEFRKILISSFVLLLGYLFGYIGYIMSGEWSLIYFFGFGFNAVYLLMRTNIIKESFSKTLLFKSTLKGVLLLLLSGFFASSGAYIDKLLIYPLLGGGAVSVYYVSTILGKTISLVIGPVTGVFLSYLAHIKRFSKNNFQILFFVSTVIGLISFFVVIQVSQPILSMLYPQFVVEAMKYVPITTASTIIVIVTSLINPILLKYYDEKWQLIINATYIIMYVSLSVQLSIVHGLMGFCQGILYANLFKLVVTLAVYYYNERVK